MLILSRKLGEQIVIGDQILVTVLSGKGDRIRLGISAPAGVPILRQELERLPRKADGRQRLRSVPR